MVGTPSGCDLAAATLANPQAPSRNPPHPLALPISSPPPARPPRGDDASRRGRTNNDLGGEILVRLHAGIRRERLSPGNPASGQWSFSRMFFQWSSIRSTSTFLPTVVHQSRRRSILWILWSTRQRRLWSSTAESLIPFGLGLGMLFLFIVRACSTFRLMSEARLHRTPLGFGRSGPGEFDRPASENVGLAGAHHSNPGRGGDPNRSRGHLPLGFSPRGAVFRQPQSRAFATWNGRRRAGMTGAAAFRTKAPPALCICLVCSRLDGFPAFR